MALTALSAGELAGLLARREAGPVELMEETLARIDALNPALNAVVSLRPRDSLLAEARALQSSPPRGPLWGLPMAVKDLVATRGIRSTWGSRILADFIPETDDLLVRRLRGAGAIVIGKTNVPEFGLGSHSYNEVFGVTRNPYDSARSAGGSSGGAAAALAARMVCLADGSDMMGSLRNPAAWCNVYGMRPSYGLVPGEAVGEMMLHPLATLGPMARSPQDLALLLGVMAGPDPMQPIGAGFAPAGALESLAGKRIGWLGDWGGAWPMEPGLLERGSAACGVLEALGAEVVPLAPPFAADRLWRSWIDLRAWSVSARLSPLYDQPDKRALMKPPLIWEIERGRSLGNGDILAASALRSDWYRAAAGLFEKVDALVAPSTQMWPFDAGLHWPEAVAGRAGDTYHRWMECVVPASLIGLPVVNLPAGFGPGGLPAGVQLIGPRGGDAALLAIARAYHRETDWPGRRPPPGA